MILSYGEFTQNIKDQVKYHNDNVNYKWEALNDPQEPKVRVKKLLPTNPYWNPNRDIKIPMKDYTEEYGDFLMKTYKHRNDK